MLNHVALIDIYQHQKDIFIQFEKKNTNYPKTFLPDCINTLYPGIVKKNKQPKFFLEDQWI